MNFRIFVRKRLPSGALTSEFCLQDGFAGIKEFTLVEPKLHKTKNAAGSFECTMHRDSVAYKSNAPDGNAWIERAKSRIIIRRYENSHSNGQKIWEGRVLTSEYDFYNQEHIYAEGALSYLNDSIQELKIFKNSTEYMNPGKILEEIISVHNSKCPDRMLKVRYTYDNITQANGMTTVTPEWPKDSDGKETITEFVVDNVKTMDALNNFLSTFGGNVRVVYNPPDAPTDPDVGFIEWYSDNAVYPDSRTTPQIVFSKNLLDLTTTRDATNLATAIFPRGYVAYSGGSDAIGDDMFESKDGSDVSAITWTRGSYIWTPSVSETDIRACAYEFVGGEGDEHHTASTGFADSDLGTHPNKSLEVKEGEVYFISLVQSDGRTCYVVTLNHLGTNPAFVIGYQNSTNTFWPADADAGAKGATVPTTWSYNKITIPDVSEALKAENPGYKLYLNISSRGYFNDPGDTYSGKGSMGIWKGRKIPDGCDEHITLKGLGDGTYNKYFYTDPETNVKSVLEVPSQERKDRVIKYPKSNDVGSVSTFANLPVNYKDYDIYYVEDENARYTHTGSGWFKCEVDNPEELNAHVWGSTGTTFYVKNLDQWWVRVVSGTTVSWYAQKDFTRDGYFIYMNELVSDYGRIEKISDYASVLDPDSLEELALYELYMSYFEDLSMTIRAIDMTILDPSIDIMQMLDILDPVNVISSFHGISGTFYIQELEIPFNDLANMEYEIGYETTTRMTRDT